MRHFDAELNRLITRLAPQFGVADRAPDTFEALNRAGSLIVWAGASEHTIYGDPHVNHAFRAWHDALHLSIQADFTLQGEIRVALEQARILNQYSETWARIIMAEVAGQAEYTIRTGLFVTDQVQFTLDAMRHF